MVTQSPGAYVARVHAIQIGQRKYEPEPWLKIFNLGMHGDARQIVMVGLGAV
jgi:hypothetical protein